MGHRRAAKGADAGTGERFEPKPSPAKIRSFFGSPIARRVAPVVLVVAALVIAPRIMRAVPRDTDVSYQLGPQHIDVRDLTVSYEVGGEALAGARFHYEDGAPGSVRHTVELTPGRYDIHLEVRYADERRRVMHRTLVVPAEGLVRIDAFEAAIAAGDFYLGLGLGTRS